MKIKTLKTWKTLAKLAKKIKKINPILGTKAIDYVTDLYDRWNLYG